jgi:hypothetical protein
MSSENNKKVSKHLVVKNISFMGTWVEQIKVFYNYMIDEIKSNDYFNWMKAGDIIDTQIARSNASLRMPLNSKIGGNKLKFDDKSHTFYDGLMQDYKLEDKQNSIRLTDFNIKETIVVKRLENIKGKYKENNDELDDDEDDFYYQKYCEYVGDDMQFSKGNASGSYINLLRMKKGRCLVNPNNYHESENAYLWVDADRSCYFKCRRDCKCGGKSSVLIYKDPSYKPKKWIRPEIKYDFSDGFQNLKSERVNINYFDRTYVHHDNFDFNELNNKINIYESYTGSGKTTFIKEINKYYNCNMVSLTSRRALAYKISDDLNKNIYTDRTTVCDYDTVYQLDSLHKMPDWEGEQFILVIDEFTSFCYWFLNNLENMKKNRGEYLEKFNELLHNAEFVICTDAKIDKYVIEFINNISRGTGKKIDIHINNKKENVNTTATNHKTKETLLNEMKKCIKEGVKFFCCSDNKETFEKEFVYPLKELIDDDQFILYDSDTTTIQSLNNINEKWQNKYIFATPSIEYGIDYNIPHTHKIFAIYYGGVMDAYSMYQQVSRIRHPITLDYYICKDNVDKYYYCVEDVKTQYESIKHYHDDIVNCTSSYQKTLRDLYYSYVYRKSQLANTKFQFKEMMKDKGYKIEELYSSDISNIETLSNEEYLSQQYMSYENMSASDKIKIEKRFSIMDINPQNLNKNQLLYFIDNKKFNEFTRYKTIQFNDESKLKSYLKNIDDITELKIQSEEYKMVLFKKLHKELNLKPFTEDVKFTSYIQKNKKVDSIISNFQEIKTVFKRRCKEPKTNHEHVKFLLTLYKYLYPSLIKNKRQKINNKIIRYKYIDFDHIKSATPFMF